MQDRIPTYAGRVTLTPVTGQTNTYDMARADQPTQAGTPLNKANLLTDATAAILGLDATATVNTMLNKLASASVRLMENILKADLKIALDSSDIDSWTETFTDTSGIASGEGYAVQNGHLVVAPDLRQTSGTGGTTTFGRTSSARSVGQGFKNTTARTISKVSFWVQKVGSPTTTLSCTICGTPTDIAGQMTVGSLVGTSTTTIDGSTLTTSPQEVTFEFSDVQLAANTEYVVFISSSNYSSSNYYQAVRSTSNVFQSSISNSSVWTAQSSSPAQGNCTQSATYDLEFTTELSAVSGTATVWLNTSTPTEAATLIAVSAEQAAGNGTISYSIKQGGTTTAITAIDTPQAVSVSGAFQLGITLTDGASIDAVAWGLL